MTACVRVPISVVKARVQLQLYDGPLAALRELLDPDPPTLPTVQPHTVQLTKAPTARPAQAARSAAPGA